MPSRNRSEIILIASLLLVFFCLPGNQALAAEKKDASVCAFQRVNLSEEQVRGLEQELRKDPENQSARAQLLHYYFQDRLWSKRARQERQEHMLWFIRNHPDCEVVGIPYGSLHSVVDKKVYGEAKDLWLRQVETHPNNPAVIMNAAVFFLSEETGLSEKLFKQGKALEPSNPRWWEHLGSVYYIGMKLGSGEERKTAARKALEQWEGALNLSDDDERRFSLLPSLAGAAFEAGERYKALRYAAEAVRKAPQYKENWNHGNAIHDGNATLGRIALAAGKVDEARKHLLEAGKTPGSPQLNSFGPDMTLAKELLEKGEKEVVLKYLEECGKFWESGGDKLRNWKAAVKKGEVPDAWK